MKKKPLYIFLHIPKCAGTTISEVIIKNFDNDSFLTYYKDLGVKNPRENGGIKRTIESLTKEQKNRLEIIFGERAFYGIHELFPNRDVRYVAFFRSPVDRVISRYNFGTTNTEKSHAERLRREMLDTGKVQRFLTWCIEDHDHTENFMLRFLAKRTLRKLMSSGEETTEHLSIIKGILDKFYFIGITENEADFLFLFHTLGIEKFLPRQNVSQKYFELKDDPEVKSLILSKNPFDQELYQYALELNKDFKGKNNDFDRICQKMKMKQDTYFKSRKLSA